MGLNSSCGECISLEWMQWTLRVTTLGALVMRLVLSPMFRIAHRSCLRNILALAVVFPKEQQMAPVKIPQLWHTGVCVALQCVITGPLAVDDGSFCLSSA